MRFPQQQLKKKETAYLTISGLSLPESSFLNASQRKTGSLDGYWRACLRALRYGKRGQLTRGCSLPVRPGVLFQTKEPQLDLKQQFKKVEIVAVILLEDS